LKPVISPATINRLPLYFRTLCLLLEDGQKVISSAEFSRRLDVTVTPEQIRKDLASFGQFGKYGVGYYVRDLAKTIDQLIGYHNCWSLIVIGLGNLGWSLINYKKIAALGFRLQAIFDVDEAKVGKKINGISVYHLNEMMVFSRENPIHIGVITVPEMEAQKVANLLVKAGVRGIWNFTTQRLNVPKGLWVVNEDFSIGLSNLSYHLSNSGIIPISDKYILNKVSEG